MSVSTSKYPFKTVIYLRDDQIKKLRYTSIKKREPVAQVIREAVDTYYKIDSNNKLSLKELLEQTYGVLKKNKIKSGVAYENAMRKKWGRGF